MQIQTFTEQLAVKRSQKAINYLNWNNIINIYVCIQFIGYMKYLQVF